MRAKRVHKQPLTAQAHSKISRSHSFTNSTISSFHSLLKRRAHLHSTLAAGSGTSEHITAALAMADVDIEKLGGLQAYQDASKLGQAGERGGDSSRVLIDWLKLRNGTKEQGKARTERTWKMLEIGALTPDNYASCSSWIDNNPIDLHSQHPNIFEQDFFERPVPSSITEQFDIISCSMVLNFVADSRDRGKMLSLIHSHLKPQRSSLLFLVLPLPCLMNSRYISIAKLQALMADIGFDLVDERRKRGGRVGFWLWAWRQADGRRDVSRWKIKTVENEGPKRNNFAILLPK